MGADGGITWVQVLDGAKFGELVTPFGVNWYDDYHDAEHDAYLTAHPLPVDCVLATYGTNQDLQGFDTLRDMLREAPQINEMYDVEPDATFLDILMSEYTLPSWRAHAGGEILRALLHHTLYHRRHPFDAEAYSNAVKAAYDKLQTHPVMNMRIRAWADAVTATIDPKSFGSAETWT